MPTLLTLLLLSYPLVVHMSIYAGHVVWAVYFLAVLLSLPLVYSLVRGRVPGVGLGVLALFSVFLVVVVASEQAETMVKAQPTLIYAVFFVLFASTLTRGSTPLISRFAVLIKGTVPQQVLDYGRWATIAWASFFIIMALISLLLSLTAPLEVWSWFANFLSYIFIGLMFVLEFTVRRWVLKEHVDYSFSEFIRDLAKVDFRQLSKDWRA